MLCCLEERETGPLTADVSVRLVPDMVFTVYTLHCTRVSVRKDKRQISLCTCNPPLQSRNATLWDWRNDGQ